MLFFLFSLTVISVNHTLKWNKCLLNIVTACPDVVLYVLPPVASSPPRNLLKVRIKIVLTEVAWFVLNFSRGVSGQNV
jgi:hypothetical protein